MYIYIYTRMSTAICVHITKIPVISQRPKLSKLRLVKELDEILLGLIPELREALAHAAQPRAARALRLEAWAPHLGSSLSIPKGSAVVPFWAVYYNP